MKERFDKLSAECSKITTQRYSTSFTLGIYFLSRQFRQPIYAIYGFVRFADEIVDSFHDYDKSYLLSKFRKDCFEAIEQGISLNPVLNSFQQAAREYSIEPQLIELFIKSMEMDLEQKRYTPQMFDQYVLGSAQAVGLMCLRIFSNGDDTLYQKLKAPAMMLGSAFQKINFLRDVNADYTQLDRTYFPDVDMSDFSDAQKQQIEESIETEFAGALAGIKQLPVSSRRGVYLAYIYYRKLFEKIKRSSAQQVMAQRFRISNMHKFMLMFNSFNV